MRAHCWSVYGLVVRGSSWIRSTSLRKSNVTSTGSVAPSIGRRAGGVRRGAERDVALAREQGARRVHADPAGAGDVDLGPRVQVGEVHLGAARAVEGLLVGGELHEVAGDEARGETVLAQQAHEQPGAVAARADRPGERLVGRLHARLHAHVVRDVAVHGGVETREELHRAARRPRAARAALPSRCRPARCRRPGAGTAPGRPCRLGSYSNGKYSAYSSMKKSNGLITIRSATRPTVIERWSIFSGKTSRATQLPNGSCCQLMKWFAGLTSSEYASIGVRECGAGLSRTTCGVTFTGRANVYPV